jgi:hypothetical protein
VHFISNSLKHPKRIKLKLKRSTPNKTTQNLSMKTVAPKQLPHSLLQKPNRKKEGIHCLKLMCSSVVLVLCFLQLPQEREQKRKGNNIGWRTRDVGLASCTRMTIAHLGLVYF